MWPSLRPSDRAAVVGAIAPASYAAVQSTAWVDAGAFENFLAIIALGAMTAGALVDATFMQATDAVGTGAKALNVPLAITQLTVAGGAGNQALINFRQDLLDVSNGFRFIRLTVTPSVAASFIGALLMGFDPRYAPAGGYAAASQVQAAG